VSRVLVIGRTGQLARALAEEMPGAACLGRDRLDLTEPARIAPAIAAARPDLVINAAAYTAVDRAEEERDLAFAVNAEAVGEIARAAATAGAALVHVSTDYVYDGSGDAPRREDAPTAPLNAYGASKLAGEAEARAANPRTAVIRTSWVISPWGRNFVLTMLGLADRDRLSVVEDQHGAPTSALDLARAIRAAAPHLLASVADAPAWGVHHLANAGETTWAGLARAVFEEARAAGLIDRAPAVVGIPTAEWPTPAPRPFNSRLDCTRFAATFGHALRPWREGLREILARLA
jgi:dTDP-4-dehydrorhamnose reductase